MNLFRNRNGQTSVEYLLLMSVAFITAYMMSVGPLAGFTKDLINDLRAGLGNLVKHAEWAPGNIDPSSDKHPASPRRTKAVHL
jgi:hypothetical protein